MIQKFAGAIAQGLKEVGVFVVKESGKLLAALISALIVIIFEEISKYYLKRKLHRIYFNEGFKE